MPALVLVTGGAVTAGPGPAGHLGRLLDGRQETGEVETPPALVTPGAGVSTADRRAEWVTVCSLGTSDGN